MIVYVNGLDSAGKNGKLETLRKLFPGSEIVVPELSASPLAAVAELGLLLPPGGKVIGLGLGGFYAAVLASRRPDLEVLALNPMVDLSQAGELLDEANKSKGSTGELEDLASELILRRDFRLSAQVGSKMKVAIGVWDDLLAEAVKGFYGVEVFQYDDGAYFSGYFEKVLKDLMISKEY